MDINFSKNDRLSNDTSKTIELGKRTRDENIVLYYLPDSRPKLAIVTGRKVGKSVLRNKLKRWTREIFRHEKENLNNFGIVVIYKPGSDKYSYKDVKEKLFDLWKKTGVAKSRVTHEV